MVEVAFVLRIALNAQTNAQNKVILRHEIIHFPTSLGVSEGSGASERMSAAEGASEASSAEQANE